MKLSLVIIIIMFTARSTFSQCYFHKTYDYVQKLDHATSIIQTSDNGFLSVGDSEEPLNFGDGIYAVKSDECGNVLWKSFAILSPGGGGELAWAVFENSINNSFIVFGNMHDAIEGASSCFILKLNANGDSVYHKIINHGYNDWCFSAIKLNDNEFILGGDYNVVPPGKRVFLSKVDSLGNIVWKYDYGDTLDGYRMKNIDKTEDGGYIIGGSLNYGPTGITQNLYLIKTDSAGNQQWEKRYPNTYYQGHVLTTADGGYLLVGNTKPSSSIYYGYVGKMDSAGNVLWQKYFDQPGDPGVFINAKQTDDGNFIVTGTIAPISGGAVEYLAKLSQTNGDIIWARQYNYFGGQSHNYMHDVIITREGDITGTGYIIPVGIPNNTQNDMFILKVDSCGYLENQNINAAFAFSLDTTSKTVLFTNQSTEFCTTLWYFGDGDSSYTKNPIHTYTADGIYNVMLIVRAGNSLDTVQEQIVILPVGINHPLAGENLQIMVYPNPNDGRMILEYVLPDEQGNFILYDATGKLVTTIELNKGFHKITIERNDLNNGVYLFKINGNKECLHNGRIVIMK